MNRRKFLSLASVGVAALSAEGLTVARASEEQAGAVGVLYDSTRCIGCRSCEAACRLANADVLPEPENRKTPEKPFYDRSVLAQKRRLDFQRFTVVNRYETEGRSRPVYRKSQCNHCLNPACASACFVGAMYKTPEGPVLYRADLCVGCRYCMVACPFYVPAYDYKNALNPLVYKCTMCAPLIASGKIPACVRQCPEKALTFGMRRDLLAIARARVWDAPDQYVEHVYGEFEAGGTSWLYLSPTPHERLDQPVLGAAAAPDLTRKFLWAVGAGAGVLSALLGAMCLAVRRRERETARTAEEAGVEGGEERRNGTSCDKGGEQ